MRFASRIYHVSRAHLLATLGLKDNPYKIIQINPSEIKFCTAYSSAVDCSRNNDAASIHASNMARGYFLSSSIGRIIDGDWDISTIRVDEMPEYMALASYINCGQEWLETAFSKKLECLIQNGRHAYACRTVNEYRDQRPGEISSLVNSIKTHGLHPTCWNPFRGGYYDNVQVNVRRDGSYLFNGGFHRFCISRILGIDSIPAIVVIKHKQWVEKTLKQHHI